ncbi:MAG: ferritin-like domain-containing protein [Hyphomicrobiaceae bacterium]
MHTLNELFEETLKDVYFAENAILKALPKMAKQASSKDLKAAFTEHVEQTEGQVERLDKIFKLLGRKSEGKECPALKGLVEETEELIGEADRGPVLDAGLIGCAQAVEHYEIARYGTLCAWAEQLKMDEAVTLLEETLEEEEATDEKLSELALSGINESADAGKDENVKEDKPAHRKRKAK